MEGRYHIKGDHSKLGGVTKKEGRHAIKRGASSSRGRYHHLEGRHMKVKAKFGGRPAKLGGGRLVGPTFLTQKRSKGEILVKTLDLRVEMPKTWIKLLSH